MASIIILDLVLTGALLVLFVGYAAFHVTTYRRLKTDGREVGALITGVRRDNIAHQTCQVTATWTDPHTGHKWTFRDFRLDLGYQTGQLIGVRLDPRHPSHYSMEM